MVHDKHTVALSYEVPSVANYKKAACALDSRSTTVIPLLPERVFEKMYSTKNAGEQLCRLMTATINVQEG